MYHLTCLSPPASRSTGTLKAASAGKARQGAVMKPRPTAHQPTVETSLPEWGCRLSRWYPDVVDIEKRIWPSDRRLTRFPRGLCIFPFLTIALRTTQRDLSGSAAQAATLHRQTFGQRSHVQISGRHCKYISPFCRCQHDGLTWEQEHGTGSESLGRKVRAS